MAKKEDLKVNIRKRRKFAGIPAIWILNILLVIMLFLSLQYLKTEIFIKEENTPFEGNFFYNPYDEYSTNTLKANFHSHSKEWLKITDGSQKPEDIYHFYKSHGYDLISLSNYQKITRDIHSPDYITAYEHGINFGKSHQLVLNAERASFFDFPFVTGYNNRQQVINRLKQPDALIALAHPSLAAGYRLRDMKYLKGYDFIEVLNTFAVSERIWDAALTSGYPAWILADDDCHDISSPYLCFNCWNRISAKGTNRDDILAALRKGCSYGVINMNHEELNWLDSCTVRDGVLNVYFRNKADIILFIADGGVIKKKVRNSSFASYNISPGDSYVRIDAHNGTQMICLNPVIRYDGYHLYPKTLLPPVNTLLTGLARIAFMILSLSILLLILIINGILVAPSFKRRTALALERKAR